MIFGKDVEKNHLRARDLNRFERRIIKPEFYEELEKKLLGWTTTFASGAM
jgi:hypothetical protein